MFEKIISLFKKVVSFLCVIDIIACPILGFILVGLAGRSREILFNFPSAILGAFLGLVFVFFWKLLLAPILVLFEINDKLEFICKKIRTQDKSSIIEKIVANKNEENTSPYWICKNCNKENSSKNNTCWNCGKEKS